MSRVERAQKNQMRSQLEEVLLIYKELQERIDIYDKQTEYETYQKLWRELRNDNDQQIQFLKRFMVSKCNR